MYELWTKREKATPIRRTQGRRLSEGGFMHNPALRERTRHPCAEKNKLGTQ